MGGKVWLVGAGPGDPGLFTLRGKEVLLQADVVVYDALVGPGILAMIPDSAERIFAGKRSGNHFMRQDETNRVLLEQAQEGKKVVRLKGGDPFLFGRGGEELELLTGNGIPFEIVPGVPSAFAVPAYAGIPVTHRDFASSVHVVTGHKRADQSYDIDFAALVRTNGTLVFLMGIAAMHEICSGLLDAGMDPDMPAAVLEKGTTAKQGKILATVGTLEAECARRPVQTPAIIVVGKVCELSEPFSWYEKRPLAGVRVVVTRPKELMSSLSDLLRQEGAEVVELPSIALKPVTDRSLLHESIHRLEQKEYDWVVFTSPSGVRIFLEELFRVSDIRALSGAKIASIGPGSEKVLNARGLKSDFIPSVYDGKTLGEELAKQLNGGERILIPRAAIGNPELTEELKNVPGVTVSDIATYDTVYGSSGAPDVLAVLEDGDVDFAVFTSASTVKGFAESLKGLDFANVRAVCIGKQTRAAADRLGMQTWMAEKATLPDLVDCVKQAAREVYPE